MSGTLTLHAGARRVAWEELIALPTPQSLSARHTPVHHAELAGLLVERAERAGLKIRKAEHGLSADNSTYFGVFDVEGPGEWSISMGLRNNHTRRLAATMLMGQRVWLCDNLAFAGERVAFRRHTREIVRDLVREVDKGISLVAPARARFELRVERYQNRAIDAPGAAYLFNRLAQVEAVPVAAWPEVFKAWHGAPCGSAWALYNAVTKVLTPRADGVVLPRYAERTAALTEVFDAFTLN